MRILWELGVLELKSLIMKLSSLLLYIFLFVSCSETADKIISDSPGDTEHPGNADDIACKYRFKLGVREDTKNIFELLQFYLQNGDNEELHISFSELSAVYDSIFWVVSGQPGRFRLFAWEKDESSSQVSLTMTWSHNFYLPGFYETCLVGYKNNEIVYCDTLSVGVADQKDFLGQNWNEVTGLNSNTGYVNALDKGYELTTYVAIHAGVPSIELRLWNTFNEEEDVFIQKCDTLLYNYINSLYRQPVYDRNSPELSDRYHELFTYKAENAQPFAIWLTSTTKIVLLKNGGRWKECWIYAEPVHWN